MSFTKQRGVTQKLVSFEPSTRGYSQVDKEVADGWSVVSIALHEKKYICILEKTDHLRTIQDVLASCVPSKKPQFASQD